MSARTRFATRAARAAPPPAVRFHAADTAHPPRERVRLRGSRPGRRRVGGARAGLRLRTVRHAESHDAGGHAGGPGGRGGRARRRLGDGRPERVPARRPSARATTSSPARTSTVRRTALLREQAVALGHSRDLRRRHGSRRRRGGPHRHDAGHLRRGDLESAAASGRPAGARVDRASTRPRAPRGHHLRVPRTAPAAGAWGHGRSPQRHEVPLRPRRRHRRSAGRLPRHGRRGAGPGGADRAQPGTLRRLAHPPGPADARGADGAPLRQCARAWRDSSPPAGRWRASTTRVCPTTRSTCSPGRCSRPVSVACCPSS